MSKDSKKELIAELIRLALDYEAANDAFDELACRKLGINRTDLRCLTILENHGPMTAGRLAELSGLTTAAVTTMLDRIEQAGYAQRVRDEDDRRQVIVKLTPLLGKRAEQIWNPMGNEATRVMSRMTVQEIKLVLEFFRTGRDLNKRHLERLRNLHFDD